MFPYATVTSLSPIPKQNITKRQWCIDHIDISVGQRNADHRHHSCCCSGSSFSSEKPTSSGKIYIVNLYSSTTDFATSSGISTTCATTTASTTSIITSTTYSTAAVSFWFGFRYKKMMLRLNVTKIIGRNMWKKKKEICSFFLLAR